eukprot:g6354.t1
MASIELASLINIPFSCIYTIYAYIGNITSIFNSIGLTSKHTYEQFLKETFEVAISNLNSHKKIDNFFDFLQKLHLLQSLQLHRVKISSSHLAILEDSDHSLSKLKVLELSFIENEINLWECCFAGELSLEKLIIHNSNVTYLGSLLAHTPLLETLLLSNLMNFGNASINQLEPVLFKLKHLKLQNVSITDLAFTYMLEMVQREGKYKKQKNDGSDTVMMMQHLEILCKNVTNNIFKILVQCSEYMATNLKALNLNNCCITDGLDMYNFLYVCGYNLREFGIGCPKIDDAILISGMITNGEANNNGKNLSMINNVNLQKLTLSQSSISGKSLTLISSKFSHSLRRLNLSWCNSIHGKDFEVVCKIKCLAELICNHCRRLHSNDVIFMLLNCRSLNLLSCTSCPLVRLHEIKRKISVHIRQKVMIQC